MRLPVEEFEDLVVDALDSLPEDLIALLNNVDVVIEDWPSPDQRRMAESEHSMILGLYEGVPLTARDGGYNIVVPDKITIFQRPIENICKSRSEVTEQVRKTVIHEIGHHFGIDEERLAELGWA